MDDRSQDLPFKERLHRARHMRARIEDRQEEITKDQLGITDCMEEVKREAAAKKGEVWHFLDSLLRELEAVRTRLSQHVDCVLEQCLAQFRANRKQLDYALDVLHDASQALAHLIRHTLSAPLQVPEVEMNYPEIWDDLKAALKVDARHHRPAVTPGSLTLPEPREVNVFLGCLTLTPNESGPRSFPSTPPRSSPRKTHCKHPPVTFISRQYTSPTVRPKDADCLNLSRAPNSPHAQGQSDRNSPSQGYHAYSSQPLKSSESLSQFNTGHPECPSAGPSYSYRQPTKSSYCYCKTDDSQDPALNFQQPPLPCRAPTPRDETPHRESARRCWPPPRPRSPCESARENPATTCCVSGSFTQRLRSLATPPVSDPCKWNLQAGPPRVNIIMATEVEDCRGHMTNSPCGTVDNGSPMPPLPSVKDQGRNEYYQVCSLSPLFQSPDGKQRFPYCSNATVDEKGLGNSLEYSNQPSSSSPPKQSLGDERPCYLSAPQFQPYHQQQEALAASSHPGMRPVTCHCPHSVAPHPYDKCPFFFYVTPSDSRDPGEITVPPNSEITMIISPTTSKPVSSTRVHLEKQRSLNATSNISENGTARFSFSDRNHNMKAASSLCEDCKVSPPCRLCVNNGRVSITSNHTVPAKPCMCPKNVSFFADPVPVPALEPPTMTCEYPARSTWSTPRQSLSRCMTSSSRFLQDLPWATVNESTQTSDDTYVDQCCHSQQTEDYCTLYTTPVYDQRLRCCASTNHRPKPCSCNLKPPPTAVPEASHTDRLCRFPMGCQMPPPRCDNMEFPAAVVSGAYNYDYHSCTPANCPQAMSPSSGSCSAVVWADACSMSQPSCTPPPCLQAPPASSMPCSSAVVSEMSCQATRCQDVCSTPTTPGFSCSVPMECLSRCIPWPWRIEDVTCLSPSETLIRIAKPKETPQGQTCAPCPCPSTVNSVPGKQPSTCVIFASKVIPSTKVTTCCTTASGLDRAFDACLRCCQSTSECPTMNILLCPHTCAQAGCSSPCPAVQGPVVGTPGELETVGKVCRKHTYSLMVLNEGNKDKPPEVDKASLGNENEISLVTPSTAKEACITLTSGQTTVRENNKCYLIVMNEANKDKPPEVTKASLGDENELLLVTPSTVKDACIPFTSGQTSDCRKNKCYLIVLNEANKDKPPEVAKSSQGDENKLLLVAPSTDKKVRFPPTSGQTAGECVCDASTCCNLSLEEVFGSGPEGVNTCTHPRRLSSQSCDNLTKSKDHCCTPFTVATDGTVNLEGCEQRLCFTSCGYHTVVTRTPVNNKASPSDRVMVALVSELDFSIITQARSKGCAPAHNKETPRKNSPSFKRCCVCFRNESTQCMQSLACSSNSPSFNSAESEADFESHPEKKKKKKTSESERIHLPHQSTNLQTNKGFEGLQDLNPKPRQRGRRDEDTAQRSYIPKEGAELTQVHLTTGPRKKYPTRSGMTSPDKSLGRRSTGGARKLRNTSDNKSFFVPNELEDAMSSSSDSVPQFRTSERNNSYAPSDGAGFLRLEKVSQRTGTKSRDQAKEEPVPSLSRSRDGMRSLTSDTLSCVEMPQMSEQSFTNRQKWKTGRSRVANHNHLQNIQVVEKDSSRMLSKGKHSTVRRETKMQKKRKTKRRCPESGVCVSSSDQGSSWTFPKRRDSELETDLSINAAGDLAWPASESEGEETWDAKSSRVPHATPSVDWDSRVTNGDYPYLQGKTVSNWNSLREVKQSTQSVASLDANYKDIEKLPSLNLSAQSKLTTLNAHKPTRKKSTLRRKSHSVSSSNGSPSGGTWSRASVNSSSRSSLHLPHISNAFKGSGRQVLIPRLPGLVPPGLALRRPATGRSETVKREGPYAKSGKRKSVNRNKARLPKKSPNGMAARKPSGKFRDWRRFYTRRRPHRSKSCSTSFVAAPKISKKLLSRQIRGEKSRGRIVEKSSSSENEDF